MVCFRLKYRFLSFFFYIRGSLADRRNIFQYFTVEAIFEMAPVKRGRREEVDD
jgi:hypothetical protein